MSWYDCYFFVLETDNLSVAFKPDEKQTKNHMIDGGEELQPFFSNMNLVVKKVLYHMKVLLGEIFEENFVWELSFS